MQKKIFWFTLKIIIAGIFINCATKADKPQKNNDPLALPKLENADKPMNVIFILSDDHRYDFMGFTGKVPWLETPNMDRMAKEGAHFENAFVTTALCSPSRASILTGQFSHTHTIIDNQAPDPGNLTYFPQYLQKGGYQTGFFGKWHMGDKNDQPRPGFDHWESFKGQGVYYNPTININGERKEFGDSTYIREILTDHMLEWLDKRDKNIPFFSYLSHKAVHASFKPAKDDLGKYKNEELIYPPSYNLTKTDEYKKHGIPEWVKQQRFSWHGVDHMYHGEMDFEQFFKAYCETLIGVDESIGRVLDYLEENGLAENTLVVYMGDNGFSFGEHGLIDKRHAYEESMKVPFLAWSPSKIKPETKIKAMVQNIDLAPTFLELGGIQSPEHFQGRSFTSLLDGTRSDEWRDRIFYEYYWEYTFPQTPTVHAVRTDKYKYIRYHGVWDTNEFYDLENDPYEMNNLIAVKEHQSLIKSLRTEIDDWMEETGGMQIPLKKMYRPRGDYRQKGKF